MAIQCSCRVLNDATINEKLEDLDPTLVDIDHKTLSEHCGGEKNYDNPGGYKCGKCKPFFTEKAQEIKYTREVCRKALQLPQYVPAPGVKEPA